MRKDHQDQKNVAVVRCRPSAFPVVAKSLDKLIKLYSAQFIERGKEGTLKYIETEFIEG